jgi:hypothetical protein
MLIVGFLVTGAAFLLLLLSLARRRRQPAPLAEPNPAAPGAPVAARAPGAALSPQSLRRRHDNSGLAHFARPATNAARRTSLLRP